MNFLAARAACLPITEFQKLSPRVRNAYIQFVLEGPSDLAILMLLHKISVMIESQISGKSASTKDNTWWIDGLMEDPAEARARARAAREEAEIDVNLGYVARSLGLGDSG